VIPAFRVMNDRDRGQRLAVGCRRFCFRRISLCFLPLESRDWRKPRKKFLARAASDFAPLRGLVANRGISISAGRHWSRCRANRKSDPMRRAHPPPARPTESSSATIRAYTSSGQRRYRRKEGLGPGLSAPALPIVIVRSDCPACNDKKWVISAPLWDSGTSLKVGSHGAGRRVQKRPGAGLTTRQRSIASKPLTPWDFSCARFCAAYSMNATDLYVGYGNARLR